MAGHFFDVKTVVKKNFNLSSDSFLKKEEKGKEKEEPEFLAKPDDLWVNENIQQG